jgi:hypothetical protein
MRTIARYLARRRYARRCAAIKHPFGSPAYALAAVVELGFYEIELAEIA